MPRLVIDHKPLSYIIEICHSLVTSSQTNVSRMLVYFQAVLGEDREACWLVVVVV